MLLTDPAVQYWSCVVAILATLAVLMLWNRVRGPRVVRGLSRFGLLVGGYAATAVAVLVSVNIAYGGLVVSVSDLFADINPPMGHYGHHTHGPCGGGQPSAVAPAVPAVPALPALRPVPALPAAHGEQAAPAGRGMDRRARKARRPPRPPPSRCSRDREASPLVRRVAARGVRDQRPDADLPGARPPPPRSQGSPSPPCRWPPERAPRRVEVVRPSAATTRPAGSACACSVSSRAPGDAGVRRVQLGTGGRVQMRVAALVRRRPVPRTTAEGRPTGGRCLTCTSAAVPVHRRRTRGLRCP